MTAAIASRWVVGGPVSTALPFMDRPLERWQTVGGDCVADFGTGPDWATLYSIESKTEGLGQATAVLTAARAHYEAAGKRFGSSVALNARMRSLLRQLNIREYRG